jgi:hypothetical protein
MILKMIVYCDVVCQLRIVFMELREQSMLRIMHTFWHYKVAYSWVIRMLHRCLLVFFVMGYMFVMNCVEHMLDLHRGQGMDIYWRDTVHCPTEEQYRRMVMQSMFVDCFLIVYIVYRNRWSVWFGGQFNAIV